MTGSLGGVLAILATPFTADEQNIAWSDIAKEVDWLRASGADGVVIGMVSEVLRLSDAERLELTSEIAKYGDERFATVTSVGAESTATAVRSARQAEAAGIQALMAIAPMSVAAPEREVVRYFVAIAEAVDIPLVVQDASNYVGYALSTGCLATLHRELGDRVYFKPEAVPVGPRLTMLQDETSGGAKVFDGTGGAALAECHPRRLVGTMPGPDLCWAVAPLWRALEEGDLARAETIQADLAAALSLECTLDAFLAIGKNHLAEEGIFENAVVRGPTGYTLDAPTRECWQTRIARLKSTVEGGVA